MNIRVAESLERYLKELQEQTGLSLVEISDRIAKKRTDAGAVVIRRRKENFRFF